MKKEDWLEYYGSSTVGERGQIALPIDIRKKFKINSGKKFLVMGSTIGGFERIVLMKPEEVTGLLKNLLNIERFMKQGGTKRLEKILKRAAVKK